MKRTFLMQEPNEDVNIEAEGFHARLSEFVATHNPDDDGSEAPVAPDAPVAPAAKESDMEDADIELPEIGTKPAATEKPFDQAAFDAETEAEVKELDSKQANRWKQLKEQVKAAKLKEAEAAQLIAQAKPAPEIQAELDRLKAVEAEAAALRQRNQELLLANDQSAVKEDEEYIALVKTPLDSMAEVIKAMAVASDLAPADLAAIIEEQDIGKQDKMIDALGSKLGSRALGRIERLADDYKAILVKEREILADASKKREQGVVARQQADRVEAERKSTVFKAAVAESFKKYASVIPGFTDSSGNLTDLAMAIQAKTESVDISRLGPDDLGYLAYAANSLPEVRRELIKLRKENAILRGSKPRGEVASGTAPASSKSDDDVEEDGLPQGMMARFRAQKFTGA